MVPLKDTWFEKILQNCNISVNLPGNAGRASSWIMKKEPQARQTKYFMAGNLSESRQITELSCLYEVTRALSSSLKLKTALDRVLEIMAEHLGMVRGTVTLLKPGSSELQIEVAHGLSAEAKRRGHYKLGEGITGRVVESGQPIVIPNITKDPRFLNRTRTRAIAREDRRVSFICVPINHGSSTIGALSIDRYAAPDVSLEDDLRLLTIISSLIAQSVIRLREAHAERQSLLSENRKLRMALAEKYRVGSLIGNSSQMQEVYEMVHRVAESNATVLLRGESGTGKSLVARAIHFNSRQAKGPFVNVNCSTLPETLIESELFGHARGAFTGAIQQKKGRFELANKGTIFLDEIGDLPHSVQVKLLGVIQDKEFQRVGDTRTIRINCRIVAATNKNLEDAMERGEFREDLYYRLNVFPIYLPPLRERKTDIILLAEYFLEKFSKEHGKRIKCFSKTALDCLMQYDWPGNVRELQNYIERASIICDEDVLRIHHLPASLQILGDDSEPAGRRKSFADAVAGFEKELIMEALSETGGNQTKAAKILNSSLRIINYKIRKYGIDARAFKKSS